MRAREESPEDGICLESVSGTSSSQDTWVMESRVKRNNSTHYHPSRTFFASCFSDLKSFWLEILVSEMGILLPRATTNVPLNIRLAPGHFELLISLSPQAKRANSSVRRGD